MINKRPFANDKMTIFKGFYSKFLRKRANIILKNFPIFHLSTEEYLQHCSVLERNFAGIVLGYPNPDIVIKIISMQKKCELEDAEPVPLGYFGEIVYCQHKQSWRATGLCGFADQRGRIWCCGDIDCIVEYDGEAYFPYCIEPIFENLFFIRKAELIRTLVGEPGLKIWIIRPLNCRFLQKYWKNLVLKFANRFEKTKRIREIFIN
ncbi:MAG: hypothetical protein K2L13_02530 [Opitutales bacterium]|nr:hypothetical protein [Opitutales bacterium]